jgi:hypothetical protein
MAHPSNLIPKNPHFISGDVTGALEGEHFFHTITCLDEAGTPAAVNVKGGGIFVYLSANSSSPSATGFIDPTTGEAFADEDNAAGFYEALSTTAVSIALPKLGSIYGRFTEIDSATDQDYVAYR